MTQQPPSQPQGLTPKALANQLFALAVPQCNGDWHEAGRQVTIYLSETIVYVIASLFRDENLRIALQKEVAEKIATAKRPDGVVGAPTPKPTTP